MTYSINNNSPIQTTSYQLTNRLIGNNSNFNLLLTQLIDNEDKIIYPKTIRDFFLSIKDSIVFKITENTNGRFIGIDTGISDNPDLKNHKIIIGNRFYGTNSPIINQEVSNSDTDIILSRTTNTNKNKISFLVDSNTSANITVDSNLNINNKDDINFESEQKRISINSLPFPNIDENLSSNSENKYLITQDNLLTWKNIDSVVSNISSIEDPNILGDVKLNNFGLEFSDKRMCPIKIGDIIQGEKFDKVPLSDILRKIIYDYSPPNITLRFKEPHMNGTIEVGSTILPKIEFNVFKRTNPLNISFINLLPSNLPTITETGYTVKTGTLDCIVNGNIQATFYTFSAVLNDGINNIQENVTIKGVYPYFYGFTSESLNSIAFLSSLKKDVKDKSDTREEIMGNGTYFFIYPHSYGNLDSIITNLSAPNRFSYFFNSPDGFWNNIRFIVYQFNNVSLNDFEIIDFKI